MREKFYDFFAVFRSAGTKMDAIVFVNLTVIHENFHTFITRHCVNNNIQDPGTGS